MADASHASFLPTVLVFCTAAVTAVPLVRRLGQSAVMGYLLAGVVIGPAGLALIRDAETTASVAEIGVVLLLFIVGLELKLQHLLSLRRDIFGLGAAQLGLTAVLIGAGAILAGLGARPALVAGLAFGLSATAIALQLLEERGDFQAPYGQRSFAVLLFQDLAIAPILALLPLLGTAGAAVAGGGSALLALAKAGAGLAAVVVIGRYGLNPFFRLLATSGAREVLTASALLVVLGAALVMERVGLSMAMGAFLAGVLLAESNFRHQLEADIEPFRGILLGLFFMSVGMSVGADVMREHGALLGLAAPLLVAAKIALVGLLFRLFGSSWRDALRGAALLAPAGEFAFVLFQLAGDSRVMDRATAELLTALAALTMLVGPIAARAVEWRLARARRDEPEPEPDSFDGAGGAVLVIGFGRFGQVVNQVLLAHGAGVTVIDNNVARIREAARFGFQIYYGDGTRLDVLRAAGAAKAKLVCVCSDDRRATTRIVELLHAEFPHLRTYVRAYDRRHAIELMRLDVDYQLRETFESALAFGQAAVEELGLAPSQAAEVAGDVRRRDVARLMMQLAGGPLGGTDLLHGSSVQPEPLSTPKARPHGLSPETRDIIGEDGARERA